MGQFTVLMPNFLIIGAMKAGTTSLYNYLKQHPEIFMSPLKEPGYFSFGDSEQCEESIKLFPDIICSYREYQRLFQQVREEKAIGEATTAYMDCPRAPVRIKEFLPNVKLIAVLRDPAERAHSHFMFNKKNFVEDSPTLEIAIKEKENRVIEGDRYRYNYLEKGLYFKQLSTYLQLFKKDQIKILLFDDLENDPVKLLQEIFTFLEVDETFEPDISIKYNVSGAWRNGAIESLLKRFNALRRIAVKKLSPRIVTPLGKIMMKPQKSSPVLRQKLINHYRQDILQLQNLIQRDLSHWLH